ncbi:MAG: LysM peptidoglycan-binding domain-containing protein [Myxococcales bacterium]|nr:LysM peptidoglycan-binding domain-containing protein [Myxococcales bacterium]
MVILPRPMRSPAPLVLPDSPAAAPQPVPRPQRSPRTHPGAGFGLLVLCALAVWLSLPAAARAGDASAAAGDPGEDAPAIDQAVAPEAPVNSASEKEASIWDFIEPGAAATATPSVKQAAQELATERLGELSDLGSPGGEPPVEYYLDPVGTTNKDPLHLDTIDPSEFDIPIIVNDAVKQWMVYFLGRGRPYYARYLERSSKWRPLMYRQIDARGMPRDLVYLSMIESGYSPGAVSYAAASGLWQFMPATGRQYKLRVDWWADDRRDPEASTRAALDYLSYLHKMFAGDWLLAWASYNGGEGRVMGVTRRYGTTDFWKIKSLHGLHTETENYVPKLIAAAIIGHHPERYGFVGIRYQPEFSFDTVDVPASVGVDVLARCAGTTEEGFLELNPKLRRWALPPDPEVQQVRIPKGRADVFNAEFAKVPAEERLTYIQHTVRKGESMGSIAKKYSVASADIARINHIASSARISVGMDLIIPTSPRAGAEVPMPSAPTTTPTSGSGPVLRPDGSTRSGSTASLPASAAAPTVVVTYKVRSGDTLAAIARAQGVSVDNLKAWNGIKNENQIYAGQRLTVRKAAPAAASGAAAAARPAGSSTAGPSASGSSAAGPAASAAEPKAPVAPTTYTVRSGDTLSEIASSKHVSLDDLKAWNKISGSTIVVGQKLIVSKSAAPVPVAPAAKVTVYAVRKGDTLGGIADRYNCTISELKSWNGLSGSTIYPGQKLKIKG